MDKTQELLKKIKALAENGVGGEKLNAERLLKKYMTKQGLTEADLDKETIRTYTFKYKSEVEKKLLTQIMYKVTNNSGYYVYRRKALKRACGCDCTQAQQIEIEFLFDFYKKLYAKDVELFFVAFVQKHKLFGKSVNDHETNEEFDKKQIQQIFLMMDGMSEETPHKQITRCDRQ